jgi:membrane protease YdiL (CAAX protease family)
MKPGTARIIIFLAITFAIAWLIDLAIYLTGGLQNSPMLIPALNLNLAVILLLASMYAPALGNIFTRLLTKEGWRDLLLKPRFKQSWRYWLLAWLLTPGLIIAGIVVFFLLFPRYFDPSFGMLKDMLAKSEELTGKHVPLTPQAILAIETLQVIIIAPLFNSFATFGEEFGWRAYLLPKLMSLGARKALVLVGVIWGVWHWPVILMGYNYGATYFGAPWLGPLAMAWFTFVVGVFACWLTLKARCVWPAVIVHGSINGIAAIGSLLVTGEPSTLIGPAPLGVIGGLGFTVLCFLLLWRSREMKLASFPNDG